jgi:WD40 repeat protein
MEQIELINNGRLSDRYHILCVLGRGSTDRTLLATDGSSISPKYYVVQQSEGGCSGSQVSVEQIEGFQRQVSRLRTLNAHPQLPEVLDSFVSQGRFFLVLSYIAGDHLATLLTQAGAWQVAAIWQLLESLLPTLQWIHAHDFIHQDIKPENIICRHSTDRSQINSLLNDWVLVGLSLTDHAGLRGSPEFAAPEQIRGDAVFASDLYSLGVVCIHLLTGLSPLQLFDVSAHTWVWRNYVLLDAENTFQACEFEQLAGFLDRLIALDLTQRFASTEVAIAELQTLRRKKLTPILATAPDLNQWHCVATLKGHEGLFAGVNAIAIHPRMPYLVSASDDKTARLWHLQTHELQSVFSGHSQFVKAVAVHPHLPQFASAGCDRTIKLWDMLGHQLIRTLAGHTHHVNTVDFNPDGSLLLSGSSDKTVKLWHVASGKLVTTFVGHRLAVNAVAFHPSAHLFASASSDTTIRCWQLTQSEPTHSEPTHIFSGHTALVRAIAFSPHGEWLATGGEDRTIRIWAVDSGQCVQVLSGHPWSVSALRFFPDNTTLLSGSWDKTIKLWQWQTGQELATLSGHTDAINSVAITPDASFIASASQDRTIRLWCMGRR